MFRRRKKNESDEAPGPVRAVDEDGEFVDDLDEQDRAYEDELLLAELAQQEAVAKRPTRPQGPWDLADAPHDDVTRVDLGGLLVPVPPDTEVRVDVSPAGDVVAATLVQAGSSMQVNAFAAPRSEGIWAQVLEEIRETLTGTGGSAEMRDGTYGPELHATVPTEVPGRGILMAPARFVGVDGPRWFLRALLTGPAAADPTAAQPLEQALRNVVVVRGASPMAVRDALPLRLPPDMQQAAAEPVADLPPAEPPALDMPERGPEITETR